MVKLPLFLQGEHLKKIKNNKMPLDPKQQPPYYTPGTGTPTIIPFKLMGLSLTQVGTSAPSVLQLFNNLETGTITPSRPFPAVYKLTLQNAVLTTNKTLVIINAMDNNTQGSIMAYPSSTTEITITTKLLRSDTTNEVLWEDAEDRLLGTQLLIIVYP